MILTGKAKEDFLQWKVNNIDLSTIEVLDFEHLSEISRNALIIEWFDSVGIYLTIGIYGYMLNTDGVKVTKKTGYTRKEATKQAIIKANEIYNETTTKRNGI